MSPLPLLALILVLFLILPATLASGSNNATDRQKARELVEKGLELNDNSEKEAGYYQKAIILDPDYAQAYFNLGFVYQSQGRLAKAVQAYKKCLKLTPKRYEAHLNLADCLLVLRGDAGLYQVRESKSIQPINQNTANLFSFASRFKRRFFGMNSWSF